MTTSINTRPSVSEATALIAKRMSRAINVEHEMGLMNVERFNQLLNHRVDRFSFENETARAFFVKAVIKQINKEEYRKVFPQMCMDANGNYTYDSSKWA